MWNVRTQPCQHPLHHPHLHVLHHQLHLLLLLSSRISLLRMAKRLGCKGQGGRPRLRTPRPHCRRPLLTASTPPPPAGSFCATMKSEQNSISTLVIPYKSSIARGARRETLAAMQTRLRPLSPLLRTARTASTPRGCLAPATCTQASYPFTTS